MVLVGLYSFSILLMHGILYGECYGYRSSLNQAMIDHLRDIYASITNRMQFKDDIVVDIGSNDGTLLNMYTNKDVQCVGVDPAASYLREYYRKDAVIISDFFTAEAYRKHVGNKKARVVTSIAMLYDVDDPLRFVQDIYDILDIDGIWVFEVSYLPLMLERIAYDLICHEHSTYYALNQIVWLVDRVGFHIIDISLNDINGGSVLVAVAKKDSRVHVKKDAIGLLLNLEKKKRLNENVIYEQFKGCVVEHKNILCNAINRIHMKNKSIIGYGAATKGNVILQYCELSSKIIPYIVEVNEKKVGCYTSGTKILIVSEQQVAIQKPDYLFVLPWHFKSILLKKNVIFFRVEGSCFFLFLRCMRVKI